ncbi:hypothetical protein [Shimia sagamensis]|uniref:HTH cro/C1-type domain-containing protein n=1 Tax=Shimia sagamensis TaxID=1566352 RepID=A0ABY1PER8_9RHOB|nr:hypothetical protein [Shimia sagamensis]SMP32035.1 hypothetical protein SAMN06265373_108120 [Shimia sagamensis]
MTNQANSEEITAIKQRLNDQIKEAGLSMRAASLASNKGPGYVQALMKTGSEPTIGAILDICKSNSLNSVFVIFGIEMSPETLRLVELMEQNPEKRDSLLALLGN